MNCLETNTFHHVLGEKMLQYFSSISLKVHITLTALFTRGQMQNLKAFPVSNFLKINFQNCKLRNYEPGMREKLL